MTRSNQRISIRRMEKADIDATLAFILPTLREIYSNIPNVTERWDLSHLEDAYIKREDAVMFLAVDQRGNVVGTAASCRYDDRIGGIKGCYDCRSTAEVSRCYVDSSLRRQGIGQLLFTALEEYNRSIGFTTFCLHTHRFLPGGFPFWLSRDFEILREGGDQLATVYMDKRIALPVAMEQQMIGEVIEEISA
ncbi:MAG TPA: GNAT family N-acetyltransferase [Patescibacteria group bacterium]|nr:GNAT family N-acetyltransferase [Patescibacteria group bacterium]